MVVCWEGRFVPNRVLYFGGGEAYPYLAKGGEKETLLSSPPWKEKTGEGRTIDD